MTKEKTKEYMEIMQAYIADKTIQLYTQDKKWCPVEPSWDFQYCNYRIKPEESPKIEFDDLVGRKIINKITKDNAIIEIIYSSGRISLSGYELLFNKSELLEKFWVDGINCNIKE